VLVLGGGDDSDDTASPTTSSATVETAPPPTATTVPISEVRPVTGMTVESATIGLELYGFEVQTVTVDDRDGEFAPGEVVRACPFGRTKVEPGSTVVLYVAAADGAEEPPCPSDPTP
jgi:hypothetical protein